MTTSLAAQLKKLSTPEAQSLLGKDYKQASFLYNDKEAATYDRQHFYNIGTNGLQQLIERDERFREFEQSLFSASSQSLQRYVQTTETNRLLDEAISKFLLRLSPYMQLREAHKAMEWLVHRYNVHLRNVDALMMCVLPYHDQEPFIMTLRLLKLSSEQCAKWRWLEPVKKGNVFLARATLITHCRAAKGFLGFVCDMLSKHIEANTDESGTPSARHLQRVISFYTQTVLEVIMAVPLTESILSTLVPAITSGLKSHDLPDHMVSSYMILSQLFMQTSLSSSLLQSFLNVIAKNAQPSQLRNAVMVLVIMFQKQTIAKVSKKALKYLSKHSLLTQLLAGLSRETKTEPFLTPFMATLVQRALKDSKANAVTSDSNPDDEGDCSSPQPMTLLMDMLSLVPLELQSVTVVARAVLNWFVMNRESNAMEVEGESADTEGPFKVFKLLEQKFSSVMDAVVKEMISADESGEVQNVVKNLLQLSVATAHQDLTSDPLSHVALCLHHRYGAVRKAAVEQLLQNTSLMEDIQNVQAALVLRLQDDDPGVVSTVLGTPQRLWELFSDKLLLYHTLQKKLVTFGRGRNATRDQVLEALCHVPENIVPEAEVIVAVLSFIVALDEAELDLVKKLLESPVTSWCRLLAHVKTDWLPLVEQQRQEDTKNDNLLSVLCSALVNTVTSFLLVSLHTVHVTIELLYQCLNATARPSSAALVILLATEALLKQVKTEDVKIELQKQLVAMLSELSLNKHLMRPGKCETKSETPSQSPDSRETKITGYLSHLAKTGCLPSELIVDIVGHLEIVMMPDNLRVLKFWDLTEHNTLENNWLRMMTTGISFSLDMSAKKKAAASAIGQGLFNTFFKALGDAKSVVKFLCMLWMASVQQGVSCTQKAHILQFSQVYFSSLSDAEVLKLVNDPTPVLPNLLILLSSQFERVKEVAFALLTSLTRDKLSGVSSFKWLADSLLQYREEVTKDSVFLSQVLKNILEEEPHLQPPSPKRRRKGSKPPPHTVLLTYLLDVICAPDTSFAIKKGLLIVLQSLDTAESFLPLMPLLRQLVRKAASLVQNTTATMVAPQGLSVGEREVIVCLLKRFTPRVAGCLEGDGDALQALLEAVFCPCVVKDGGETIQMLAVAQLNRKFMAALAYTSRQAVLSKLLDVMCSSKDVEMGRCCRKATKRMAMESSLVVDELRSVLKSSAETVREAKRQKQQSSDQSEEHELDTLPWRRIITLLEMVQSKKKVSSPVLIVPVAFQVLGRVLEVENKGSGEYVKQLLLGTINYICSRHEVADAHKAVKGEHLNMDLIVQCIRSSDNPHTHHQALLLLSLAAKISPDLLLHNMMSVFTFMGANILRQDDAYSFHVIGRILDNVIPALIMACEEKVKDRSSTRRKVSKLGNTAPKHIQSEDMMTAVLRVFVDAIPHIPAHRKIMLFDKLLRVVGHDKYLWRLMLLFIESVTVRSFKAPEEDKENIAADDEKNSGPVTVSDLEFLTSLVEHVPGSQLCQCFHQALTYVISLPEEKPADETLQTGSLSMNLEGITPEDMEIFNVPYHTAKQLRHFKFALVFALNHLVSGQHLVAQLAEADPSTFLPDYQRLMETVLQFVAQVTQSHEGHRGDASSRFWRILLHKLHDLLDNLVNLLPDSMFMDVVMGLVKHPLPLVQRRAIELLNTKLQQYKESLSSSQADMLLSVTSKLRSVVRKCLLRGAKTIVTDEEIVIGQTALYSLKLLCRILGEKNQKLFIEVLKVCTSVLSRYHNNGIVSASSMLCIAEIVSCVKVHSIEHIGEFVPLIISQLKSEAITSHEVLLLAAVTSLQKIIESVPLFLSPYLLDIIVQACIISSKVETQTESHKPAAAQKVKLICSSLATVTPTRTFLPVLEKSFMALQDKMASCAECAMTMLRDHIVKMTKEDLTTFAQDLLKFFLSCFDIRATHSEISEPDLDVIEGRVIEAFVSLVFKLSEAQFRPMLLQIYSWATDEDVSRERVLVFYRLCDSLAEKLKSLFTLFAGHIIKHSAEVLDANNKSKTKCKYFGKGKIARRKSCRLLCYVIDCLQKTLSSDTEGFLNKERFDVIMQPLVDQLENQLGKDAVSEDRVKNHVVPCLASLAAAARDDSLWKDLNYQILLKTRHQSPEVRIWALSAVDAFHKQLGEDYTHLVPETIPFMAELMEDESDEVEKYTHKVLAAMEVSVGENLQEYF